MLAKKVAMPDACLGLGASEDRLPDQSKFPVSQLFNTPEFKER